MKKKFLAICLIGAAVALTNSVNANAEDASKLTRVKLENGNSEVKENHKELDDEKLNISLDDYLRAKESMPMFFVRQEPIQKTVVTPNGLNIIETDFKWNGKLDYGNKPEKIILHHIEASRPGSTIPVTDIDEWHKANGWCGIGYHFYVTKTGKVYRGRPEDAIGAHALNHNVNTLGIAVEGKYQSESMPKAQKDAVIKLGQYLRRKYEIDTILRHKDVNSTDCPGKNYPFNDVKNEILKYPIKEPKPPVVETKPEYKEQSFNLGYSTSVEGNWQKEVYNGKLSGTTGQAKKLEGIKINLYNSPQDLNIVYKTHMQSTGWSNWTKEGNISGTKGKRLEAVQIKLEGAMAKNYSVVYRTHIQGKGWSSWTKDGQTSGTVGEAKRLEAIEVKIEKKESFGVNYTSYGEDYKWQSQKWDGQLSGTTGQRRRIEGVKINLHNAPSGVGIKYQVHCQTYGWKDWVSNGTFTGTTNENKRLEAIKIQLTGKNAEKHSVEYRVHVEGKGWMPWVKNGSVAGTTNEAKRIEGIEIRIK